MWARLTATIFALLLFLITAQESYAQQVQRLQPSNRVISPNIGLQQYCQRYSRQSASDQRQNQGRGCGYSGPAWWTSYSYNFKWCMNVGRRVAEERQQFRTSVLANCRRRKASQARSPNAGKVKFCKMYAQRSLRNQSSNRQKRCFLKGPQWHSDYNWHYQWCLLQKANTVKRLIARREYNLRKCKTVHQVSRQNIRLNEGIWRYCISYIKNAIWHYAENKRLRCGYKGSHWHNRNHSHWRWCLGNWRNKTRPENSARVRALQDCRKRRGSPRDIFLR